jgi:Dihydroxyacid dehydratase/phosphogluconate dehydratase
MMSNIVSKVTDIRQNIERRSADSRSQYLRIINEWKDKSPNTNSMGCSNVAHTYAACNKSSPDAIHQPMIGIVSAYNDMLSAHAPFEQYPKILKDHGKGLGLNVQVAAGVPAMCDGITQGEPGMELSLFSRDTIALSTAIGLSHNVFNGIVCMGTCDKIVPGLVIGALRHGHLPAIFVSGGPMSTGISNTEKSLSRKELQRGKLIE